MKNFIEEGLLFAVPCVFAYLGKEKIHAFLDRLVADEWHGFYVALTDFLIFEALVLCETGTFVRDLSFMKQAFWVLPVIALILAALFLIYADERNTYGYLLPSENGFILKGRGRDIYVVRKENGYLVCRDGLKKHMEMTICDDGSCMITEKGILKYTLEPLFLNEGYALVEDGMTLLYLYPLDDGRWICRTGGKDVYRYQ